MVRSRSPLARSAASSLLVLGAAGHVAAQAADDPRLRAETWFAGLLRPVCATFVGPGEMLVFQNTDGRVLRIVDGAPVNEALDLEVSHQGARGIVTDPGFANNGYVYLYYCPTTTTEGGAWEQSLVMRYTFDGANLVAPFGPLFTVATDPAQSNALSYTSGYLRFGPDGMLYGQVGDKGRGRTGFERIEQNTSAALSSLAGGIFRIATDGTIPLDNPFVAHADPGVHPWFVYGFRNSLGMDFDPITGELWFSDNSVGDYDEINRGGAGMNSGWMLLMGPDARDVTYSLNGNTAYDASDLVMLPGAFYRDPEFSYKDAIGITTIQFLDSKRFPEDLRDDLVVGDSNFGQLYRFDLNGARDALALAGGLADKVADDATERDANRFATGLGTITDTFVGPDGYLYVVSHGAGAIFRVRPVTDLVEPFAATVVEGALLGGGVAELDASDDADLVVGGVATPAFARRTLEARFALNASDPTRLDVEVEAAGSRRGGVQRVLLLHVASGAWHLVDERELPTVDAAVTIADVPMPEEYVDPITREVTVRVVHRAPVQPLAAAAGTPGTPPAFVSSFDLVRVLATLP